jgi:hypothetical protein
MHFTLKKTNRRRSLIKMATLARKMSNGSGVAGKIILVMALWAHPNNTTVGLFWLQLRPTTYHRRKQVLLLCTRGML